jgi:DNA polymerase III delta prime subunit
MVHAYIQKGEAVLVHSTKPFDIRNVSVREYIQTHPEVIVFAKEKILMEDLREFVYQSLKESVKVSILIFDDMVLPAQQALLKTLEDIQDDTCILLYAHAHSTFIPTVLSRVIITHDTSQKDTQRQYSVQDKTIAERFDMIKHIMKEYEDEKLSKQDIIDIVAGIQQNDMQKDMHADVYLRAFSMLKQPSVSIKYVLEYVCGVV